MRAGAALLEKGLADFLYLSLTDYIQHKFAPEEAEALNFYQAIDVELGRMLRAGGVVGLTADHGMNAKQTLEGRPNVIYLEERLQDQFGDGFRVILPITDPYVRHHGALGSFAVIHLPPGARAEKVAAWLIGLGGITEVYDQRMAVRKLELPADRIGDLVVLSARDMALGRRPVDHDLSALDRGLRSHGGRYEEMVPFLISRALNQEYSRRALGDLRNFDLFDFTVNGGNDA
jgi:phosphonoacetate hydrolase